MSIIIIGSWDVKEHRMPHTVRKKGTTATYMTAKAATSAANLSSQLPPHPPPPLLHFIKRYSYNWWGMCLANENGRTVFSLRHYRTVFAANELVFDHCSAGSRRPPGSPGSSFGSGLNSSTNACESATLNVKTSSTSTPIKIDNSSAIYAPSSSSSGLTVVLMRSCDKNVVGVVEVMVGTISWLPSVGRCDACARTGRRPS